MRSGSNSYSLAGLLITSLSNDSCAPSTAVHISRNCCSHLLHTYIMADAETGLTRSHSTLGTMVFKDLVMNCNKKPGWQV